jgi:hypothetical protein
VYRPENGPGVAFEEVRVEKTDQEVVGPTGKISGAIEVIELHMDGTREAKVFAPGYGEFSTGNPGGDLETVSLAVPTDSRPGSAPAEFDVLSDAARGLFHAAATTDAERVKHAVASLSQAWNAVRATGIPPQMETQMAADIDALEAAVRNGDSRSGQSAALRIAQNELDLRLLYQRVIEVDMDRLALWAQQLPVDVGAADGGAVLADVAALEQVWERTRYGVEITAPVDESLHQLRRAADEVDLPAVGRVAVTLTDAVGGLRLVN